MRIAIFEDDMNACEKLIKWINDWSALRDIEIDIQR